MHARLLLKQLATWRLLYVIALLASLSFFGVNAFDTYEPTVKSDKEDYQPGDTAIITGYGWLQDEYVDVHLEEDPAHDHHHSYHDTKVNPDGTWVIKYPIEDRHLGVKFTVIADGKQTGTQAITYFTDAITWTLTMSANASNIVVGEETIFNFTGTVTGATAGDRVSCIRVIIPNGFDYVENSISDNNNNWTSVVNTDANTGLRTIQVNANGNGDRLNSGNSIQFSIKAVANVEIAGSSVTWQSTAGTTTSCSNTTVAPANGQPTTNISKASQIISFDDLNDKFYGDEPFILTASATSGLPVTFSVEGAATLGTNNLLTITGVGTVTVKANQAGNNNYNAATEVVKSFNVNKATAIITLNNSTHTYDGNGKVATVTTEPAGLTGVVLSYKAMEASEEAYSASSPVNAGNYNVRAELNNSNYQADIVIGTLLINKADQSISWANPESIEYGTLLSSSQLNASLTKGDGALIYNPALETLLNAGSHELEVSAAETNNYKAATTTVSIQVTKATPTVSLTVGGPYTYDGSAQFVSSATVTGLAGAALGNAVVTYSKEGNPVESPTNAGSYAVIASFAGSNNYEAANATGTLVIDKATATLTISGLSHTYDGTAKAIGVTPNPANLSGLSVIYSLGSVTVSAANVVNAGNYLYYVTMDNENYSLEPQSGTLTIAKADMVIKADDASKTYGDENPVFTGSVVSGAVQGEAFNVTASSAAVSGSDVGEYDIIPAVAGSTLGNYNVTAENGKLTITKRPVTVTANTGQSKVYGESDPAAYTYQITSGSLLDNAHLTGVLTRVPGENVGSYAITQGSIATTNNYALTYFGADYAIGQRAVEITADVKSKSYGDDDPEFTYEVSSGSVVNGDTFSGVLNRVEGESVGDYAINLGTLSLGNNYSLGLAGSAVLGITPKTITVTPSAGQSKVYGSTDPVLAYTNTALVGSDSFTGALSRESGSNVGAYNVTQGTLALSSNYTVNFMDDVKFNITPKSLTASISATDKVYDGTTSATATGSVPVADLVASDVVTVDVSEANFDTKDVGTGKAVNANVSISNPNYSLTSSSAATTASITPAPLSITAPSMSKYCGQVDPTGYSCNVTGAANGEQFLTSYAINGTVVEPGCTEYTKLSNYNVTYINGTLTINGLTLDASNASNPRSIHEDVVITVSVKDGDTNLSGVSVKLLFDGVIKGTAVSDANGIATFALGKSTVNVYAVTAEAGNACSVSPVAYLPVYDPEGGFVTGGGWINSPQGALDGSVAIGKANFGFVAKYKKGNNEVEGNTEFQFQAGSINFKSSAHNASSLVISGAKATYKGTGFVSGNSDVYEFMVVAKDAQVNGGGDYDRFRIKIWKGGDVLYDNARGELENADLTSDGTKLGGGSIVIHENKSVGKTTTSSKLITEAKPALEQQGSFYNYPNAFSDRTTIAFALSKAESYALEVYDVKGALVKNVSIGVAEADKLYEFEVDGRNMAEGIYIARLVTSSNSQSIKMILKK